MVDIIKRDKETISLKVKVSAAQFDELTALYHTPGRALAAIRTAVPAFLKTLALGASEARTHGAEQSAPRHRSPTDSQ